MVLLAAQILVLAVLPSSYRRGEQRHAVLLNLYQATGPLLTWFLVLSALISVVLIRIVVATAYSYGLSQYALEVLVRTLVLELIPLYAALFVAVRYTMPESQRIRRLLSDEHRRGQHAGPCIAPSGGDHRDEPHDLVAGHIEQRPPCGLPESEYGKTGGRRPPVLPAQVPTQGAGS